MRKSPAAETGRDHPFGGFDDQPVPDRSGLAQGCFQALQDLDDVVVRQILEPAGSGDRPESLARGRL